MPKEFKEDDCPVCPDEGLPGWMGTFADMMTLLFAFFVLLFSMSSLDPVKMAAMAEAMTEESSGAKDPSEYVEPKKNVAQIKRDLKEIVEDLPESIAEKVKVSSDVNGVSIEMQGEICFGGGSVDLNEAIMDILDIAAKELMSHPTDLRPIFVQGHTDNDLVSGALKDQYPTNWELSSARAAVVVNYLITANNVKPGRLRAMGFSDRWPFGVSFMDMRASKDGHPLVDDAYIKEFNSTPEKKSKNRRIKIVFTPS